MMFDIGAPPDIDGKMVRENNDFMWHIRRGVSKKEIKEALFWGGTIYNYLTAAPDQDTCYIEFNKFFEKYPVPYQIPTEGYLTSSLFEAEDSAAYSSGLVDEDPQRLQIMLNIALEYYKFTGEIIWPNTFGKKEYKKIFEPWKNEHKKRFKVLMKIIEDYWAEEEREEKEGKKD